jgi:hypothetical protein
MIYKPTACQPTSKELVFEINRLILITSSVHSAILDMHVKSEILILHTTCHDQYETRFSEVFLVRN